MQNVKMILDGAFYQRRKDQMDTNIQALASSREKEYMMM